MATSKICSLLADPRMRAYNINKILGEIIIKPGEHARATGPRAPGFLKSFYPQTLVHVYVCVSPKGINNK